MPYPRSIITEARNCPNPVVGDISPYPTVVIVTIVQYILFGILEKSESSWPLSTMYITVPIMQTRSTIKKRKYEIL